MPPLQTVATILAVVAVVLSSSPGVFGQTLSLGGMAGANLTDDFRIPDWSNAVSGSTGFLIGPMMGVEISDSFSVEVNALHRRYRYSYTLLLADGTTAPGQANIRTWEIPLLVKYTIPIRRMRPFIAAGPSFRVAADENRFKRSNYGINADAGVDLALGALVVAPTIRYTRWAEEPLPYLPTVRNQFELLVKTSYRTTSESRRLFGRKIWLGLIAGVPLTGDFPEPPNTPPPYTGEATRSLDVRFLTGLMVEMELANHLALEVNGLYRRLHFIDGPEVVVTWQIPALVKYRFSRQKLTPFVEAGPSFRLTGNLNNANPSHYGVTSGAGLEARWRRLRIAPTLRYTRWAPDPKARVVPQALTNPNHVEFVLGVSF